MYRTLNCHSLSVVKRLIHSQALMCTLMGRWKIIESVYIIIEKIIEKIIEENYTHEAKLKTYNN